jgi:predicted GNAT family acetyltransferase
MVCESLMPCKELEFQVLEQADVMQMRELVKLTQPGPFANRIHEFGTYIGIKSGARLIAMAGERMKVSGGFDEVSAVCTHPEFQGRGYARALVYLCYIVFDKSARQCALSPRQSGQSISYQKLRVRRI